VKAVAVRTMVASGPTPRLDSLVPRIPPLPIPSRARIRRGVACRAPRLNLSFLGSVPHPLQHLARLADRPLRVFPCASGGEGGQDIVDGVCDDEVHDLGWSTDRAGRGNRNHSGTIMLGDSTGDEDPDRGHPLRWRGSRRGRPPQSSTPCCGDACGQRICRSSWWPHTPPSYPPRSYPPPSCDDGYHRCRVRAD